MRKYLAISLLALSAIVSCKKADGGQKLATNVVLSRETVNIHVAEDETITAHVLPENLNLGVIWSVVDPDIASVDNGKITGKSEGVTYVIALSADGAAKASCMVSVNPPNRYRVSLQNMDGEDVSAVIGYPGCSLKFKAVTSDGIEIHNFSWTIEDENVATVTEDGEVTMKAVQSTNSSYVYYGETQLIVRSLDDDCGCKIPVISSICKGVCLNGKYYSAAETVMVPSSSRIELGVLCGKSDDNLTVPKEAFTLELSNTDDFSLETSAEANVLVTATRPEVPTSLYISLQGINGKEKLADIATEKAFEIKDFSTLREYLDMLVEGTAPAIAEVIADVTLTSSEAAALKSPANYAGTIIGNGHTIKGLVAPLFESMADEASISALTIEVNITSSAANIGAFAANGNKASFTGCTVNGSLTLADLNVDNLHVGGFVGTGDGSFLNCTNNASITVASGTISAAACIGGILGYGNLCFFDKCRNTGAITMEIATGKDLQIGGIVSGDIETAMDGCSNAGPISINAQVGNALYVGGVLGYTRNMASLTNLTNESTGTITCAAVKIKERIYAGGVVGGQRTENVITHSYLKNYAAITFASDATEITTDCAVDKWGAFIGGIAGGLDTESSFEHCENYGKVYFRGKHRSRVGGITSFAGAGLKDNICKADIRVWHTRDNSYKSNVGGIAGYAAGGTYTNLVYKGFLNTQSSSPRAFTGGMVGLIGGASTFQGCKFGGRERSAGSASDGKDNCLALMCCVAESPLAIDVKDCIIETGTQRTSTTITSLSLNYSSTASVGVMVTGTTAMNGTTTLNPASSGTMTNCSIGSIE